MVWNAGEDGRRQSASGGEDPAWLRGVNGVDTGSSASRRGGVAFAPVSENSTTPRGGIGGVGSWTIQVLGGPWELAEVREMNGYSKFTYVHEPEKRVNASGVPMTERDVKQTLDIFKHMLGVIYNTAGTKEITFPKIAVVEPPTSSLGIGANLSKLLAGSSSAAERLTPKPHVRATVTINHRNGEPPQPPDVVSMLLLRSGGGSISVTIPTEIYDPSSSAYTNGARSGSGRYVVREQVDMDEMDRIAAGLIAPSSETQRTPVAQISSGKKKRRVVPAPRPHPEVCDEESGEDEGDTEEGGGRNPPPPKRRRKTLSLERKLVDVWVCLPDPTKLAILTKYGASSLEKLVAGGARGIVVRDNGGVSIIHAKGSSNGGGRASIITKVPNGESFFKLVSTSIPELPVNYDPPPLQTQRKSMNAPQPRDPPAVIALPPSTSNAKSTMDDIVVDSDLDEQV